MIEVYSANDNSLIGTLTESQLQFMMDNMEEESLEDQDYAITPMTLAYFEELGADPALLEMLRRALGSQEELMIRWERP
jgi:processive 1,2-diacylglycerol beta-glucosyltransferase